MRPNDPGPIYTETLPGLATGLLPVEPWNTWSNIIFVLLLIHIAWRTRVDYRRYTLIVMSLPILTIGIIGGTVCHATRSHVMWLFMDFMPIVILTSADGNSLSVAYLWWGFGMDVDAIGGYVERYL